MYQEKDPYQIVLENRRDLGVLNAINALDPSVLVSRVPHGLKEEEFPYPLDTFTSQRLGQQAMQLNGILGPINVDAVETLWQSYDLELEELVGSPE